MENEAQSLVDAHPRASAGQNPSRTEGDAGSRESSLRALRRRLAPALVDYARDGHTAIASGVLHEDVSFFVDPNRYTQEYQKFFREMPLVACLSSDLPEPGSYRTFDEAGAPVFLTRGKDKKIRAFLNVCPHRASRIVRSERGNASRFTCRFHGWTFDTMGKAIGIPEEAHFCGEIDASKHLVSCPAEERHGFVFVRLSPGTTLNLDAYLGELDRDLAAIGLEAAEIVHSDRLPVRANWKYGLDTFFETYHLKSLHRESFKGLFSPVCVFDTFGPHHRYTFAPLGIDAWAGKPENEWQVDLIPLQYFLFPNTIVSVGSTGRTGAIVNIHQIFPSAVDRFVSLLSYCVLGGVQSEDQRAEIDRAYETSKNALVNEDYSVAAEAHLGLVALPPAAKLPVGRQEIGVQNFHRNVATLLQRDAG